MKQNEMTEEFEELLAFFKRGSSYDVIQSRQSNRSESAWTFAPCDVHATEKAAWMMRRMGVREIRHARRAKLHNRTKAIQVMVVTDLPERLQAVLRLIDGGAVDGLPYLTDESLVALEAAFAPSLSENV